MIRHHRHLRRLSSTATATATATTTALRKNTCFKLNRCAYRRATVAAAGSRIGKDDNNDNTQYSRKPQQPVLALKRNFSDRLLGYSPMAPPVSSESKSSSEQPNNIPTAQDVTTSGGVWAPTSAKREKLGELGTELLETQATLDDAATPTQLRDLYLVDGLHSILTLTDNKNNNSDAAAATAAANSSSAKAIQEVGQWLNDYALPDELHLVQWEEFLRDVANECDRHLSTLPFERSLQDVRDYLDPSKLPFEDDREPAAKLPTIVDSSSGNGPQLLEAEHRTRLLLLKAVAEHLQTTWEEWTAISDADIDRAAAGGDEAQSSKSKTMATAQLRNVLSAFLNGACAERLDALWKLLDKDQDGLLDEVEMNYVCEFSLRPVQAVLTQLWGEALSSGPILTEVPPTSWRQRRRERNHRKRLEKLMSRALVRHFRDEVELSHRLRCCYAWANKEHQNGGEMQSILVDAAEQGWSGRKRYVELAPKISFAEFQSVQSVHLTHLDRIGAEYLSSLRNDLWVLQGKGRQNRELARDCALFLLGVSLVDFVIISL